MKFDPYVIFAGAKDRVITSSRNEELQKSNESKLDKYALSIFIIIIRICSNHICFRSENAQGTKSKSMKAVMSTTIRGPGAKTTWEVLTLVGAFMAIVGFTAQFIGLRGLTYPCAIAHLFTILLMATIRAFVRRRLGRLPANTAAIASYELDFLAINIAFCPKFRNGHPHKGYQRSFVDSSSIISQWGITTVKELSGDKLHVMSRKEIREVKRTYPADPKLSISRGPVNSMAKRIDEEIMKDCFESATSEKLLLVRKRLGDLCRWKSKASESSLSLTKSIDAFMDAFLSPATGKLQKEVEVEWVLETFKPHGNGGMEKDVINIPIKRTSEGHWVDLGIIEAMLSIWMANIETRTREKERSTLEDGEAGNRKKGEHVHKDWRHIQTQTGSKYKFCRVLGDDSDEHLLKRDLSWWVDELLADQSDDLVKDGTSTSATRISEADIVVGFNGRSSEIRYTCPFLSMLNV